MFDLRKIDVFCKVCEQGSFSRAGELLFLSQPTVSAHIQALEKEFDSRLLDRMGKNVLPTPAGLVLYRHARQAVASLEEAYAEIQALSNEVTGDLRIGSSGIPAHHILPEALALFSDIYPKVRFSLVVDSSAAIARQVADGGLMAGVVGASGASSEENSVSPLLDSEIVLIAPPDLPGLPENEALAPQEPQNESSAGALPSVNFTQACALPWILREYDSGTRRAFEEVLRLGGFDARLMRSRLIVDSSHAAIQYVKAGLGVSAVARVAVEDEILAGGVRAFSIAGARAFRRFFCIINKRRAVFPAADAFMKFLLQHTLGQRREQEAEALATTGECQ